MTKNRSLKELETIEDALGHAHNALAYELSRRYVEKYPDDSEGKWFYGQSLYFLDKNIKAKPFIEAALPDLSGDARAEALAYLADINSGMNELSAAEGLYEQAITADPTDASNYVGLATLLLDSGRQNEAVKIALKGLEAEASPVQDIHSFLGKLYRSEGEIIKSYEAFQQVLEADEDDDDARTAIDDLEAVAVVLGIQLSQEGDDSDGEQQGAEVEDGSNGDELDEDGDEQHDPGNMVVHIHRKFFVEILEGRKKVEYRQWTPYWSKRINNAGEPPFHLRVINGMLKNAPELTIVVERVLMDPWADQIELHLGEIIDVKNWSQGSDESIGG